MKIEEFCGNMEFSIIQFTFSFTNHIREKIKSKELFYKEQIIRYVQKQIEFFLNGFNLKSTLLYTYKYEVYNTIMFKLKTTFKENNIFQCF